MNKKYDRGSLEILKGEIWVYIFGVNYNCYYYL